jgi:hypothetical protein
MGPGAPEAFEFRAGWAPVRDEELPQNLRVDALAQGGTLSGFVMVSLHFAYYGADTIDDASARQRIAVASTDQIGSVVKGIGDYLKLVHKADDLSPIPDRLGALVRRAA